MSQRRYSALRRTRVSLLSSAPMRSGISVRSFRESPHGPARRLRTGQECAFKRRNRSRIADLPECFRRGFNHVAVTVFQAGNEGRDRCGIVDRRKCHNGAGRNRPFRVADCGGKRGDGRPAAEFSQGCRCGGANRRVHITECYNQRTSRCRITDPSQGGYRRDAHDFIVIIGCFRRASPSPAGSGANPLRRHEPAGPGP